MTRKGNRTILAILCVWAACGVWGAAPPDAGAADGNPAAEGAKLVETFTLGNGLTVVIRENHSSPVVAVQVWVKAGSTTEPEERAGMSHILEHMAFKGTKRRGPGQIAREVEALGGGINGKTSLDRTGHHSQI